MTLEEHTIQVDYDGLREIVGQLSTMQEQAVEMRDMLHRHSSDLAAGLWKGEGASRYFSEYNDLIKPGLDRLVEAMDTAQSTIKQIEGETLDLEEQIVGIWQEMIGLIPDGQGGSTSPSLFKEVLAAYNDSTLLKVSSTGLGTYSFLSDIAKNAKNFPSSLNKYLGNRYVGVAGKTLSVFGTGLNLANFIEDPGVVSGLDTGVSAIGLSGNPVAGAFSFGWGIGSLARPYTTPYLSDKLTEWDPLDLGYSPRNYPNTVLNDYERAGKAVPRDVAKDIYRGLRSQDSDKAWNFAKEYSREHDIDPMLFHMESSWGVW
ncbi:MAG: WXG100 family type VII secretion target [Anaerolineales bacterium]